MPGVERRRRFVESLEEHPLVADLDCTRDGYRTVVLELATEGELPELDECLECGAIGVSERIREHDCPAGVPDWRAES